MYYVRRDGRIKGPLSREKLRSLRQEKRLRSRDEISAEVDGPWRPLREVYEQVLGDEPTSAAEWAFEIDANGAAADADAWSADDASLGSGPDPQWQESLRTWIEGEDVFRRPLRPVPVALAVVLIAALTLVTLAIVLSPS